MKKCVMIMNPQSGKVKKTNFDVLFDILEDYDYNTEIRYTKKSKDATDIVKDLPNDVDLVISCGGDGTLNEVVTGNILRDKKLILADLPMGSVNDVGNMYGLNSTTVNNLKRILDGQVKDIDVCYINDTPFVYVAALGDYVDIAYATPRHLKKKYGRLAYFLYGIKGFFRKIHNYDVKYKVDGSSYTGNYSFFFITNTSRIGGFSDIYYDFKLDDNMFEVALVKVKNFKELIRMFVLINTRNPKDIPGITYYQTDNFEIEFLNKLKTSWCIDGEEYKNDNNLFKFSVSQDTKMLMPKINIKSLFKEKE